MVKFYVRMKSHPVGLLAAASVLPFALLVVLLAYPSLVMGEFCEVTITAVRMDSDGYVEFDVQGRASSGTTWGSHASNDPRTTFPRVGGTVPVRFPAWPGGISGTERHSLLSREERQKGIKDSPAIRDRFLLVAGQTYIVRKGERLVYYRRINPDGTGSEVAIMVFGQDGLQDR